MQSLVARECIAAANSQGGAITCALRNVLVQLHAQGALLRAAGGVANDELHRIDV